jgi:hypothetical protein
LLRENVLEDLEVLNLLLVGNLKQQSLRAFGQLSRLALATVDGPLDGV